MNQMSFNVLNFFEEEGEKYLLEYNNGKEKINIKQSTFRCHDRSPSSGWKNKTYSFGPDRLTVKLPSESD